MATEQVGGRNHNKRKEDKMDNPFDGNTMPTAEEVCEYINEKHDLWGTDREVYPDMCPEEYIHLI